MYNGIGLQTPRGSGTNGYVQRNLAFVKSKKDRVDYKNDEEIQKLEQSLNKGPNQEILDHERKRKVELKCMEMQELMEEQGYTNKEVMDKVNMFRKMLMAKEGVSDAPSHIEKDEHGRPIAKETHQLAEANLVKNDKLREAFGLTDYVEGSAFDPSRKAKEDQAKAVALAQKKYSMVNSSDEEAEKESSPVPKKKKKKSSRHEEGSSPERSKEKRKKSRKHSKRDRSHSKKHRKRKHQSQRRSQDKKKTSRHSSPDSESGLGVLKNRTENGRLSSQAGVESADKSKIGLGSVANDASGVVKMPTVLGLISLPNSATNTQNTHQPSILPSGEIKSSQRALRSRSLSSSQSRSRSSSRHRRRSSSRSSSSSSSRERSLSATPHHKKRSVSANQSRSQSFSRSRSYSHSRSRSSSFNSHHSKHRESHSRDSRSPSIRRRNGSPCYLDKRRITSRSRQDTRYSRDNLGSNNGNSRGRQRSRPGRYSRSRSKSRHRQRSSSSTSCRQSRPYGRNRYY